MIDSRKNDAIYKHPQHGEGGPANPGFFREFVSVHPNHDRSQLLLTLPDGPARIAVFDQNAGMLTEYTPPITVFPPPPHSPPPVTDSNTYIRPNRKIDRVYFVGNYQFILYPPADYNRLISNNSLVTGSSADFGYKEDRPDTVYVYSENKLLVIDYTNPMTTRYYDAVAGLRGTTTTTDGKYLIMYTPQSTYMPGRSGDYSTIVQISAESF